jgi:hypothetical protein
VSIGCVGTGGNGKRRVKTGTCRARRMWRGWGSRMEEGGGEGRTRLCTQVIPSKRQGCAGLVPKVARQAWAPGAMLDSGVGTTGWQ